MERTMMSHPIHGSRLNRSFLLLSAAALCGAVALACKSSGAEQKKPAPASMAKSGASACLEAELCDGQTKVALASVPETREEGQAVADAMMAAWIAKNPDMAWETEVRAQHYIAPSADNSELLEAGQSASHTGARFTQHDLVVWERETETLVVEGARIFHSGDELGSTIAVSCDMCHPNAANTHPETYPKFQKQLGRVAGIWEMINWCIRNPLEGKDLAADAPGMIAIQAYLAKERRGVPLAPGRH
jgi:thiosulfate dehydrogenase